jgi:hypothetical protein
MFILFQIIITIIEQPNRTLSGVLSPFDALPPTNALRSTKTDAILVRCEVGSMRPRERWLADPGGHGRARSAIGARLDSTTLCSGGTLWY